MKDLLLDTTTHDLKITDFYLSIVESADSVAQSVKVRLLFFKREWFLDTAVGLPFYEDIFVKAPNLGHIDAIIKAEILDTPEVNSLIAYESDFDRALRKLTVTFTIDTTYGPITITETL